MKKLGLKRNISLFILLILLLLGFVYEVRNDREVVSAPAEVSSFKHEKVSKNDDTVTISLEYPEVPGSSGDVADANTFLKTEWDGRLASFEKDAAESKAAGIPLPETIKSTVTGGPSIEEQNERYISIYMGAEWYLRGAAHPSHTISTYVYDFKNKKFANLESMFKPDSNYLELLSELSKADLQEQASKGDLGYEYMKQFVDEGTKPTKENFSHILPLKDGLMIYFEEYQVAPYAAGPQQVVIPYEKLKSVINPDGVLGMYSK